jgi:hypothetical protein
MKKSAKLVASSLAWVLAAVTVHGATGTFGSFVQIDPDGPGAASPTWYGCTDPGAQTLTGFDGHNLGSFTAGSTATISGGELLTFKNGGGDVTAAEIRWRITGQGETIVGLGWTANATFNAADGESYSTAGDQKWAEMVGPHNFLAGLTAGNYTLEVWFLASTNEGDRWDTNLGSNFVASFTVTSAGSNGAVFAVK